MSRENKFKVYCEFEVDGILHKEMAETANWFLLSQTGQVMTHEPMGSFDPNAEQKYKKLIPLFFTGLLDKNGKEIYEGDVVRVYHWLNGEIEEYRNHINKVIFDCGAFNLDNNHCYRESLQNSSKEVIGNIYENPELINEKTN